VLVRLGIAAAILVVVGLVAWRIRRRPSDAPPRDPYPVPRQLVRADFPRPEAAWLVAYFSSATCGSCQGLGPKVQVLDSAEVSTIECTFEQQRELHDRYDIAAIPMILVADRAGIVQRAFIGATTATDLWASLAELRAPGSTPEPGLGGLT
jgi:hypothetical protein